MPGCFRSLSLVLALVVTSRSMQAQATTPPAATATRVEYVRVVGEDYAFTAPERISAGIVAFNLENRGTDLHALAVFELPANHTLAEFLDMYHSKGIIPPWMTAVGQTAPIAPKQDVFLTVRLKPGRYILSCLIPAKDGRAHTEKGMVKLVTVR